MKISWKWGQPILCGLPTDCVFGSFVAGLGQWVPCCERKACLILSFLPLTTPSVRAAVSSRRTPFCFRQSTWAWGTGRGGVVSEMGALQENRPLPRVGGAHLVHDKNAGDLGELGQTLEHLRAELAPSPLVRDIHENHHWKLAGWGGGQDMTTLPAYPHPRTSNGMGSGQPPPPKLPRTRGRDCINWASDSHPEPNPDQQIPCSSMDLPTKRAPDGA